MNKDILDKSLTKAFNKGINGGVNGLTAMTGQVVGLMWMRTIMNYQYRHGGNFSSTFNSLGVLTVGPYFTILPSTIFFTAF